jgi:hypothetical protein
MAQLGDLLAGAAGAPVNRPALDAYVTQGQAMAGLRTAQTEEALGRAQQLRDEQEAKERLVTSLSGEKDLQGNSIRSSSEAGVLADVMRAHAGTYEQAEMGHKAALSSRNMETIGNPSAPQDTRVAAMQANSPMVNPYQNVEGQLVPHAAPAGGAPPPVTQTDVSAATAGEKNAGAHLKNVQAAAGGFNPHVAGQVDLSQYPELQKAVDEGRLDPFRVNTRSVSVLSQLAHGNPTLNFNEEHAASVVQANPTFRQRAMIVDSMPTMLNNVVAAGKKMQYSDLQVVGMAQKWLAGQTNDPALTEYMTQRNDSLMKLASVMRGVGMSDQAHQAEIEAMNPTLSPSALDGWMRGQMKAIMPLQESQRQFVHHGEPGVGHNQPAPAGAVPPSGVQSLDAYLKAKGF